VGLRQRLGLKSVHIAIHSYLLNKEKQQQKTKQNKKHQNKTNKQQQKASKEK
jgi:hypothetical protein